jgi:hypothetical protein
MKNFQPIILMLLIMCVGCSGQNPSSSSTPPGPDQISYSTPKPSKSYSTPEPSKNELTRDTVLRLVQGRIRENVIARLNSGSFYSTEDKTDVYTKMINDKIIRCTPNEHRGGETTWINCVPGEHSSGLSVSSSERNALDMIIGVKVPNQVTGISKIDPSRAEADVDMRYEPNEEAYALFNKYSNAFWSNNLNQASKRHVILKLYDDGWRLENWQ